MRCKEDNLSFPYKKDKEGIIRFLSNFQVMQSIPRNTMNVVTEGVDPEALYWLRLRLLRNELEEDQVPALPELDLNKYTFKPWKRGQCAGMLPETTEERSIHKLKRKLEKEQEIRKIALDGQALWGQVLGMYLGVSGDKSVGEFELDK